MKELILIIILVIFQFGIVLGQESSLEIIELNEVILKFEKSIEEKDSISFKKLFFHEKIPFIGIMSKETEMSLKKDYPEFEGVAISNSNKFIKEICETEKAQKERFYNIKISNDGVVASINFDYAFESGGKTIQWGNENWNLVKVKKEWLITDVIYSIRFPDIEEFSFKQKIEKNK